MIDPNDRTTPRPCPVCGEDFTPGKRGPVRASTTCSRAACRKASQRARRREIRDGLDTLNAVHTYAYGEPLDPPMTARRAEPAESRLDLDANDVLPPGVLAILVEEYGLRLDVQHDGTGVSVAYLAEVTEEEHLDAYPEHLRREAPFYPRRDASGTFDLGKAGGTIDRGASRARDLAALRRLAVEHPEHSSEVENWLDRTALDDVPRVLP